MSDDNSFDYTNIALYSIRQEHVARASKFLDYLKRQKLFSTIGQN